MIESVIWLALTFAMATSLGLPLMLGHFTRILVATLIMGGVLSLVTWPAGVVGLILAILCGGVIYGVALLILFDEIRTLLAGGLKRLARGRSVRADT
jgi:hypothetical protein